MQDFIGSMPSIYALPRLSFYVFCILYCTTRFLRLLVDISAAGLQTFLYCQVKMRPRAELLQMHRWRDFSCSRTKPLSVLSTRNLSLKEKFVFGFFFSAVILGCSLMLHLSPSASTLRTEQSNIANGLVLTAPRAEGC